jgi:hypothetical protein
MDLAKGNQRRISVSRHSLGQESTIPKHIFPLIRSRKPKIQLAWGIIGAVRPTHTAFASAETMPEPIHSFPR